MISYHYRAADEMAALFKAAAAAQSPAWPVEWPNLAFEKPAHTVTWARWSIQHTTGGQETLAGADGRARYGKGGFLAIEIFTPLGRGVASAFEAAQVALDAYEGKRTPSDVWFRNCRIADSGEGQGGEKGWWSTLVVVDFTYQNLN